MSTTQQHTNIPSTAAEFAPGLWRTNLQRDDHAVRNAGTGTALATDVVEKGRWRT